MNDAGDFSMKGSAQLHQDLLSDIEWSQSRTMTMSSMYGPSGINCCLKLVAFIWKWSKPLTCIWIIAVECLLAFYVYWDHTIFFSLCMIFISIPLLISSLYISYTSYQSCTSRFDSDRITYFSGLRRKCLELLLIIPLINTFMVLLPPPSILIKNRVHYTLNWQSIFILILSVCMTVPQFILNICFIMMHEANATIHFLNWLQIITCIISLSVISLFHWSHIYALDSIGEQVPLLNALKLTLFWHKFQYYADIFFYIYFMIIILELIHCLPILFEYFYYKHIDLNTMLLYLYGFNGAKIICFSHYIYNIAVYKGTNCCCNLLRLIFLMIIFLPLPLFPFMTITYKSLFEKRVLLLDQNNNYKIPKKGDINRGKATITTKTGTIDSANLFMRKSTDKQDDFSNDDESDESDDEKQQQQEEENEVNERSPIHNKASIGSGHEDLRRYHTMDSNLSRYHTLDSNISTVSTQNSMNIYDIEQNNMNGAGYHFEQYDSMKSIKCQYMLLVLYFCIAYIGCNVWLIGERGGIFCLGLKTQIMIYVIYGSVFIAIIIYSPIVMKRVLAKAQLVLIGDEHSHDDLAWI